VKILMQSRLDAFSRPGGDTIQMIKTKEYLGKRGCEVDIDCHLNPCLDRYDIVHLFNIVRVHETYLQLINAKKKGKPVALSSIYQNYEELDAHSAMGIKRLLWKRFGKDQRELVKTFGRGIYSAEQLCAAIRQLFIGFGQQQRYVIENADIILPNSKMEMEAIGHDFGVEPAYLIVPNAVDQMFLSNDESFSELIGMRDYILCVANYTERKNQLSLLSALKYVDLPVVLVGMIIPTYKSYYEEVKRYAAEMKGRVKIFEKMSHKELVSVYSGARVVVLPSWIETTGLVCLEGALAGCNVVVTNRGYTKEYFKDMANYCDPANPDSIKKAVIAAYDKPRDQRLREHILANFTWEKAAAATEQAYVQIIGNNR